MLYIGLLYLGNMKWLLVIITVFIISCINRVDYVSKPRYSKNDYDSILNSTRVKLESATKERSRLMDSAHNEGLFDSEVPLIKIMNDSATRIHYRLFLLKGSDFTANQNR